MKVKIIIFQPNFNDILVVVCNVSGVGGGGQNKVILKLKSEGVLKNLKTAQD